MRRSTLAVGLLLAVLFPVPSPAEDAAMAGDEGAASAPSEAGEAKAAEANPEPESADGEDASEAAAEEAPEEASGEEAEASGEEGGASGEKGEAGEAAGGEEAAPEEASADAGEADEDEAGFGAALLDYANNTKTQFLTGLNGILTWPADPVMATVNPPKAFDKAGFERRPLGFASGLLLMVYRSFTGTLDVALALGPIPVMSPVPRYKLIPGFEHEDE